jgi:DNA-binding HxlR family transcriptional regulator
VAERAQRREPANRIRSEVDPVESDTLRSAQDLDRIIHERTRLAIVSSLATVPRATFKDLKALLDLSDGNLSVHTRKLEEAGYVRCHKSFAGRMPKTEYELTSSGRQALGAYLEHMESLISTMRENESVRLRGLARPEASEDSSDPREATDSKKPTRSTTRVRLGRRERKKP